MSGDELAALGLRPGEPVRFRRPDRDRWQDGRAAGRERDGSVRITDHAGAARAVPVAHVLVRRPGPRGAMRWEPLADRVARPEQRDLFADLAVSEEASRGRGRRGRR